MTPPWAFMDGMGLAHRRAVGLPFLLQVKLEGFEAGSGDIVGLILDPIAPDADPNTQPVVIGVEWEDLAQDCFCV